MFADVFCNPTRALRVAAVGSLPLQKTLEQISLLPLIGLGQSYVGTYLGEY